MDEKKFLKLFEKHARKMREVKSYWEMIRNIQHPEVLSGAPCPFGGIKSEKYFVIARNGRVIKYDDDGREASHYHDCVEYWQSDFYLKNEMVSILRKLQKEERGK